MVKDHSMYVHTCAQSESEGGRGVREEGGEEGKGACLGFHDQLLYTLPRDKGFT